ncbi:MAG: ArsR family transcriptional regulator [Chloroflexi bacterium]|nr:ArsR family transcriptional regulator [Chloroflexota bacterium]
MISTRQQIINMLENQKFLTAGEIGRALHLTPANIRHHLSILVQEGVIEVVGQQKLPSKGRPQGVFSLTRQIQSHNLAGLAHALLKELTLDNQPVLLHELFSRVAYRLAQHPIPKNVSLNKRLFLTMERLNKMHYQARWEAHAQAPRIYLGHCPYALLLPEHPELCQIDALLLSELIDYPVIQLSNLEKDEHGTHFCLFAVK